MSLPKQLPVLMRQQIEEQRYKIKRSVRAKRKRLRRFPCVLSIPGWNERVMTEADFLEVCEREGIVLLQLPFPIHGCYYRYLGIPTIVINSRLRGLHRLRVAFHELGHYFLHDSESLRGLTKKEASLMKEKHEAEAEAVAAISLIPKPLLSMSNLASIKRSKCLAQKLLKVRHKVLAKYSV